MNFASFNAVKRIHEWVVRESGEKIGTELSSDPIFADYHKRRIKQKIDQLSGKALSSKAQEAINWLADFIGYHSEHEKFLPEVVAQINVRVGNIIEDCELDGMICWIFN